jgi:hypothetical protein
MSNETPEFRKEEAKKQSGIADKLTMVQNFASALTSRGLKNEKTTKPVKQLRVLSCFGNTNTGGVLPPCEHLKESSTPGKHFCGGCGCGDRKGTWLVAEGEEYSKLDYPKLACPLQMPGFTNYKKSEPDESVSPITRRYYIENMSYRDIEKVSVTVHGAPPVPPKKEETPPSTPETPPTT